MKIEEVSQKETWEGFLEQCSEKTFLHSWQWGEFQKKEGNNVWRFGIFQDERIVSVVLAIFVSARRGSFLFIPHGPVMTEGLTFKDKQEVISLVMLHLYDTAKEKGVSFVRFSPILRRTEENQRIFEDAGFKQAPLHMHPEETWELAIGGEEEDILYQMRKTTRYLIKQAEKNKDIEIVKSKNKKDLELFYPVYKETAIRQKFTTFSKKYIENEFDVFSENNNIEIFLGKYKGEIISSAIFVFWQGTSFYHHSGSLSKYRKIPASYLLQWEAIKEAKRRGCNAHNFWGISPKVNTPQDAAKSRHPWAGLSLFKIGFGGEKKEYVKTQDFVLSNRYWLNYIVEKIRKIKRRL